MIGDVQIDDLDAVMEVSFQRSGNVLRTSVDVGYSYSSTTKRNSKAFLH